MREVADDKFKIIGELREAPNVTFACNKVGVSRATYYRWLNDDKQFKKNVDRALKLGKAKLCDIAEMVLMNKLKENSLPAATFVLRALHPDYKQKTKEKIQLVTYEVRRPKEKKLTKKEGKQMVDLVAQIISKVDRKSTKDEVKKKSKT